MVLRVSTDSLGLVLENSDESFLAFSTSSLVIFIGDSGVQILKFESGDQVEFPEFTFWRVDHFTVIVQVHIRSRFTEHTLRLSSIERVTVFIHSDVNTSVELHSFIISITESIFTLGASVEPLRRFAVGNIAGVLDLATSVDIQHIFHSVQSGVSRRVAWLAGNTSNIEILQIGSDQSSLAVWIVTFVLVEVSQVNHSQGAVSDKGIWSSRMSSNITRVEI